MDYSTWKHLNDNGYRPVEYIYKPDNFSNPLFGLGIIAYGNKYGLEVKMQASQEDIDYAMSVHHIQICGYLGLTRIDNLPYQNCCQIYIRQADGYYLGRQINAGWYTKPDGTITNNSGNKPLITPCDTDIHIVSTYYDSESDTIKTFLDGMLKNSEGSKSWENDLTAGTEYFVYGYNTSSGTDSFKGRIYYIKTFDPDRNVTGHFIPCVRKSDGRAGLYDIVNNVFKTSTYDYIKAGPYPGQRLPYDYKEVDYIKNNSSSGGLDTGMKMSITDYSVESKFKQDEISDGMPLGTLAYDVGSLWFYNYTAENHNEFCVIADYISGWKVVKKLWQPCNTDIHTVKFDGHPTGCDISWDNGNTYSGTYVTPQQYSTDNLFVFGRNTNSNCYYGRIYYVKLWNTETGAMLLDYVPCVRMSDNTPGFYDLVSNEFKTITDAKTKWEAGTEIIVEQIPWTAGTGNIRLTYTGIGNGTIVAKSDDNNLYEQRSMDIVVSTTAGSPQITRTISIVQAAKQRIDISAATVTAANQTYSGSAKTPTPTVKLNGVTIPSTGYDITYSDNTNAGTATITVTGKGEYIGTASGTFTIAKANPIYTAPTAQSLTYNGSSQYLTTLGSTSHGTIQYSADGTNWYTTRRTGTGAGTYTTYWRLVGDANHNDVSSTSISVTIAQKALTITAKAQTITYGGSIATGTSQVTTSGLVSGDSLTAVTLTASTSSVTTSGTITPSAATTSNGIGNYSVTYATGNLTINKAASSVTSAPTAKSLTYSRSAQSLVNAGSASGGTLYYKYTTTNSKPTSTGGFSSSIPTRTDAGTYYVWYYVKGDSNHNNTAISSTAVAVTIAKATPVVATAPSKRSSLTYSGSAQNLLSGGTMKHSNSDSTSVAGTFSYAQGTNAGTYSSLTWSFTPTDTTNYNTANGTVSGSVSIAKASRTLSFADSVVVVAPSGTVTKTATPSAGSGDGAITYNISSTTYATINSSSGKVTAKTSEGNATVTASIAEGTNYLSATATYTLYVFATQHDFDYTGSVQNITLPPGTYQLQVWGAQGGSTLNESGKLGSTAGGKGGYSEGQLTITASQALKVYVGGMGTYTVGGYNGGGNAIGSIEVDRDDRYTLLRNAAGGGATDIRLSNDSLYSRIIVAGGGNGGAALYVKIPSRAYGDSRIGWAGGGENGEGYNFSYMGYMNKAGKNGSFGQGANAVSSEYRYQTGAAGGGWYGGGVENQIDETTTESIKKSGAGSGWVNTSDYASYRPSGYSSLQLDSGQTIQGTQSFPSPSGTNETGHSGNGYARITRL